MLKKMTLAALATISMSAFAQTSTMTTIQYQTSASPSWNKMDETSLDGKSDAEIRKMIEWRANWALSGGDRYTLATMLDRAPMNVEKALIWGLAKSHRQAVMINDQMLAWRFPQDTTVTQTTSSSTDSSGNVTTTTTTTTMTDNSSMNWSAMDWSGQEASFRPMRMVMTRNVKPKDISYDQALEILTSDLGDTSAGILADWWNNGASIRQKDVVVRLLKDDASMADQTYYPSVYMHRTYSWITNP